MADVSKIKIGDEGTVRVRFIEKNCSGNFKVEVLKYGCSTWVSPSDIATHTPKPRAFKPGDRVTCAGRQDVTIIIAVECGDAWLRTYSGGRFTQHLNRLRHADESE